ncbi:hypothetical protein [Paludisphaera mucosa]|uniref:Uncharacterized protein n=1 Tax=Paludisphaera mucosa TaxID=3030827 RepID=A0ABT6FLS0_9BACT|nr:hypothetical protein [Paludisphaera mucosa]MDG3008509.1 hypothetical protein [Paludisphaera mucosa]
MIDAELPDVSHAVERAIAGWRALMDVQGVGATRADYHLTRRGRELLVVVDTAATPWSGEPTHGQEAFRFPLGTAAEAIGSSVLERLVEAHADALGVGVAS